MDTCCHAGQAGDAATPPSVHLGAYGAALTTLMQDEARVQAYLLPRSGWMRGTSVDTLLNVNPAPAELTSIHNDPAAPPTPR